jgi:hypothetical protein
LRGAVDVRSNSRQFDHHLRHGVLHFRVIGHGPRQRQ